MKITDLQINPDNPRFIKDFNFQKLVNSLKSFPEMMKLRPIVVISKKDKYMIIGGTMRYRALESLGYEIIPDEWIKVASNLTEAQIDEFIVKDNIQLGEWDFEALGSFDPLVLEEWGLELPDLSEDDESESEGEGQEEDEQATSKAGSLVDRFIVPPFSVLDARQGYWQNRKRLWLSLGIQSELGRGDQLIPNGGGDEQQTPVLNGLTWGNSPAMRDSSLNYYRKKNR